MRRNLASCLRRRCSLSLVFSVAAALAAEKPAAPSIDAKAYAQAVDRAVDFLEHKAQAPDGSYAAYAGPGVTAVVTTAILRHGRTPDDPVVAKSLKYLQGFVQPDGAVSLKNSMYRNYETSLALVCFAEANRDGRYDKLIKDAERFLKDNQWTETQGQDKSSPSYGGAGYGKHKRPDLSNTNFLVDALRAAGAGPDDEAMQKALIFVSRCQNLESEHNTLPWAAKNPDGGFYYTAAAGGESPAGKTPDGGLRSYGSMTYAGLKSMIYAGVAPRRSPRQGGHPVDRATLRSFRQSRHGPGRPVLLLSLVRQGARCGRLPRGCRCGRQEARLAPRPGRRAVEAAAARRLVGQPRSPLAGRRAEPGDRLRAVGAVVLQTGGCENR